jgi:uncharacterized protein
MLPKPHLPDLLDRIDILMDSFPAEHDPMLLSQVDGLLAALLVAPNPIDESDWLPLLWGGPPPQDEDRLAELRDLLKARMADMAIRFLEGDLAYDPVYDLDRHTGTTVWELWMSGFEEGIKLGEKAWLKLLKSRDEDLATCVLGLSMLMEMAGNEGHADNEMVEQAPELIPYFVETLYRRQHNLERVVLADQQVAPSPKVGRNDPCPCGSGKKFKRCCGAT